MRRIALALVAVCLLAPASYSLLPSNPETDDGTTLGDIVLAGEELASDCRRFCERNRHTCRTVMRIGRQARERALSWMSGGQGWVREGPPEDALALPEPIGFEDAPDDRLPPWAPFPVGVAANWNTPAALFSLQDPADEICPLS